jgi:hypothetical protein
MPDSVHELAASVEQIAKFSGKSLSSKVSELEFKFENLSREQIADELTTHLIGKDLLGAARSIKKAAAQIDVVLHALGHPGPAAFTP